MKISRQEFGHEYGEGIYRFGYSEYAKFEHGDDLSKIYAHGFLPHSADPELRGVFYMARGARIALPRFALSSENRRIAKRFDNTLEMHTLPAAAMPEEIKNLFLDYFAKRHGKNVMSEARLEGILASSLPLSLAVYSRDAIPLAAVLEVRGGNFGHFWFSAYDLALVEQSLGLWLMQDGARRAKADGLEHYYLGTVYGPKALYKTNFAPLEFWDGSEWNDDVALLKRLAREEAR